MVDRKGRRRSLAELVPEDLPEDVKIPEHGETRERKPAASKPKSAPAKPARSSQTPAEDAEDTAPTEDAPKPPRRRTAARTAAQDDGETYPKRITLPVTVDDYRELNLAKIEDDINVVTRLRAMIDLWKSNSRFRAQVDRHARHMR